MKVRVLSALVGLVLLAIIMVFYDTLLFNVVIGVLSIIAVLELLNAAKLTKHRSLTALTVLLGIVIPFARVRYMWAYLMEAVFVLLLLFFILLLRNNRTLRFEQVAMAFFFGTFAPLFFSCAVFLRDEYGIVEGGFYFLLALGSAWLCDTCAYFVGMRFGKHKLAPRISPKKTVEGLVGGLVFGTALLVLLSWAYSAIMNAMGTPFRIHYGLLLLVIPFFGIIGVLGDLSASTIKRNFDVKDFGHIMPGHGGVLDRFDSVLFTLPTVYLVVRHVQLVIC